MNLSVAMSELNICYEPEHLSEDRHKLDSVASYVQMDG